MPKKLSLYCNKKLSNWLGQPTTINWSIALAWIDTKLKTISTYWNDYWNNHVRFCNVIEPYMTLFYSIKHGDIGFFWHTLWEITVIPQVLSAKKPKYTRAIIRQIPIFNIKISDPQWQEAYLANVLVNSYRLPHTFYKSDLLLKH